MGAGGLLQSSRQEGFGLGGSSGGERLVETHRAYGTAVCAGVR